MTPTRIYVPALLALHRAGLAEGGGAHHRRRAAGQPAARAAGRTRSRVLEPDWPVPPVFGWLARTGGVAPDEMLRVFNCGIGMALVVADADAATELLRDQGESVAGIGHIEAGSGPPRCASTCRAGWPG